ncbi:MAG: tetratricopeptide repeat protein [Rubellimicrobium sp.]|nr:tetratricopeptide repeat protein [Rubellimicrobium sp.]
MLKSSLALLALAVTAVAVTYGAIWLAGLAGGAVISVAGLEVSLSPLQMVVGLGLLVLAAFVLVWILGLTFGFLRFLGGGDTALSHWFGRGRERKGLQALTEGLQALATGDGQVALARAERANRLLDRPALTRVLLAQAAGMTGDTRRAEAMYRQMSGDRATRFVALHGLMRQRLAAGDSATAMRLARKALAERPANVEVQDTLLRLQGEAGDWKGARETLAAKQRSGTLPRDVWRRREAVLALAQAGTGDDDTAARATAVEASRLAPDLVPAAVAAARAMVHDGQVRQAARTLRKAWEAGPHPDLAAAYAALAPDEAPAERLKRFEPLLKLRPDDPETRVLEAELLIAAEDFPAARRALGRLPGEAADARVLTLMAAIERGSGAEDAVVRGWLTRALTAPRGRQWVCGNCQQVHAAWAPLCEHCHALDSLEWREPPGTGAAMPGGVELLPLIVGSPREATPDSGPGLEATPPE